MLQLIVAYYAVQVNKLNLDIPEKFKPYVSNYKMNIVSIPSLSNQKVNMFNSDFRFVAEYFVQKHNNLEYHPSAKNIRHPVPVFNFMSAVTGESFFKYAASLSMPKKGVITMTSIMDRLWNEGMEKGRKEGRKEGREEGREEGEQQGMLKVLSGMVQDNVISLAEAAKRMKMSVAKFKAAAKKVAL